MHAAVPFKRFIHLAIVHFLIDFGFAGQLPIFLHVDTRSKQPTRAMTEITPVHIVVFVVVSLLMIGGYLLYIWSAGRAVDTYKAEQAQLATALNPWGQNGAFEHRHEVAIKYMAREL